MTSLEHAKDCLGEVGLTASITTAEPSDLIAIIQKHMEAFARESRLKVEDENIRLGIEAARLRQENRELKSEVDKNFQHFLNQTKIEDLTATVAQLKEANRELLKDKERLKWAMDYPDRFNRLVWEVFNVEGSGDAHVIEAIDKAALAKERTE